MYPNFTHQDPSRSDEDAALELRVVRDLNSQHYKALRQVRVEARDGAVYLRGRVRSFHEKQFDVRRAKYVPGVKSVVDELVVSPIVKFSDSSQIRCSVARALPLLFIVAMVALSGCSRPTAERLATYPVNGRIEAGKSSLPGAFVVLHPRSGETGRPLPVGQVTTDGAFTLSTYTKGDGAPAGQYAVTVEWPKLVRKNGEASYRNALPDKLSRPESSGLTVTISEGQNAPRIVLSAGQYVPTQVAAAPRKIR